MTARQTGGRTFCVLSFLYPTLYQQHNYQHNYNQQPTTNTLSTASSTLCTNTSNIELKKNVSSCSTDVASAGHLSPPSAIATTTTVLRPVGYDHFHHIQLRNNVPSCHLHFARWQAMIESSHQILLLSKNM